MCRNCNWDLSSAGGAGLNRPSHAVYDYFLNGTASATPELDDVVDHDIKMKIEKVK